VVDRFSCSSRSTGVVVSDVSIHFPWTVHTGTIENLVELRFVFRREKKRRIKIFFHPHECNYILTGSAKVTICS